MLSFASGTSNQPLLFETVDEVLKRAVERGADQTAVIAAHQSIQYTFREFDAVVESVACGLVAYGLTPGERVGIWAPNCVEWLLTMYGAARAGLVLVSINPAYRIHELEYALRLVGCRALVFAPSFKGSDYLTMLEALIPEIRNMQVGRLRTHRLPELRLLVRIGSSVGSSGYLSFEDLKVAGARTDGIGLSAVQQSIDPDQPVNIQFTSGTTGSPKGATLTHFNIVNNAFFVGECMHLTDRDRICIPVPLYHCFGMVLGVLAAMTHGASTVLPSEGFDPLLTLQTVERERCTALYGVPTMFIAELEHPEFGNINLTSLRTGIMAGAPCPISIMRRVVSDMHMPEVTICYGMTETSPVSFQSACDDSLELRVSTVGRIHPHVQVKIIDELGHVTQRGTRGELLTRGYGVMRGYWGEPVRTREAIDTAGWMHTGDLGVLDDEGYCKIVGRVKDMIIRGGENVHPGEIEEYLYRHPAIFDVVVVGVPDYKYGEEICACVRLRPGAESSEGEIREFCRGQIAHYKVPRYVRFVESFPMTVTGKVQRHVIREQLQEMLKLVDDSTAGVGATVCAGADNISADSTLKSPPRKSIDEA